jgi:hypothetical protein
MSATFAKQLAQSVYTKEQLETALGCCVCRADTDNEYYRNEDLKWECVPTRDDPGVLGPNPGAVPAACLVAQKAV